MTYTILLDSIYTCLLPLRKAWLIVMSIKQYEGKIKLQTDTPFGYTLSLIGSISYKTLSTLV